VGWRSHKSGRLEIESKTHRGKGQKNCFSREGHPGRVLSPTSKEAKNGEIKKMVSGTFKWLGVFGGKDHKKWLKKFKRTCARIRNAGKGRGASRRKRWGKVKKIEDGPTQETGLRSHNGGI